MSAGRTERLLALVLLLTSTSRPLTRSEIRAAVLDYGDGSDDAFERMFERDKDELRSMGIPLDVVERDDEDEGVGYRLSKNLTFLPSLQLDPAESMVLALAARSWGEAAWSNSAVLGLRKLEAAGDFDAPAIDTVAFSPNVETQAVATVLDATTTRRRVSFQYRKPGGGAAQQRNVEPWGLVTEQGRWYLVGNDVDRQAVRAFRLSRVVGELAAKGPTGAFEQAHEQDLRSHVATQFGAQQLVDATVQLRANSGFRLREAATSLDGEVATFTGIDSDWLVSEVLRAGSAAEVLQPATMRDSVRQGLQRVLEAHPVTPDATEREALAELDKPTAMSRNRAEETATRLSRLLALVPWLQAHPGVTYAEAAHHFGISPKRLREDLELAVCTEFGTHMLTLDIDCWGDRLTVRNPQGIDAPLRLAPDEAMSLLIGLRLLSQVPGTHDRDALARVESKLQDLAGEAAQAVAHLEITDQTRTTDDEVANVVAAALSSRKALRITYWGAARDQMSTRTIDPIRLVSTRGVSYLDAWCRQAEALRLFRLDRISAATELDEPAIAHPEAGMNSASVGAGISPEGPCATLALESGVGWLAEQIPARAVQVLPDGRTVMRISLGSQAWAVRLVLGMGGQVRVFDPADLVEMVKHEAAAAVAFYVS